MCDSRVQSDLKPPLGLNFLKILLMGSFGIDRTRPSREEDWNERKKVEQKHVKAVRAAGGLCPEIISFTILHFRAPL